MYPMHLNFLLYCDVLHVLHVYINLDGVYINKDEWVYIPSYSDELKL